MAVFLHQPVNENWHIITLLTGEKFFATTHEEAVAKARAYLRERTLEQAERGQLPLLPDQVGVARRVLLRDIAEHRHLRREAASCLS